MNAFSAEELIDHPPRDDAPAPPRLADAVMTRIRREPVPRRVRWWPALAAGAAALVLLPGDGGAALDPELVWTLAECALAAGLLLLVAPAVRLGGSMEGASWTA